MDGHDRAGAARALDQAAPAVAAVRPSRAAPSRARVLGVSSGAHALHDGFTDGLYVLLPLWQAEFALSYGAVGLLRALYTGAMAGFQVPVGALSRRLGGPLLLALGTALAGLGLVIAGLGGGLAMLAVGLFLSGLGSATQHPIASDLVAHAFSGARSRPALGTYNFAGDIGKMAVPAALALLLTVMPWRPATMALGALGLAGAVLIVLLLPRPAGAAAADARPARDAATDRGTPPTTRGFWILFAIGVIDSATRMGFLTFLPFLLQAKGAGLPEVGVALMLVFGGGAAGKLVCGFLGERLGVVRTVFLTEGATALGILLLLPGSLPLSMALLPLIGLALNGTSSVLYGTVPEFTAPERRARAFGIFYTGTIGGGAVSPILYGLVSDAAGIPLMMTVVAAAVLATLPLAALLRPSLRAA
jgi:MFS family permease